MAKSPAYKTPYRRRTGRVFQVCPPAGFFRVWSGQLQVGDLYLDALRAELGRCEWRRITFEIALQMAETHNPTDRAELVSCLVRQTAGGEVGRPCARCGAESPPPGYTICLYCQSR